MSCILHIETSTKVCSVALSQDGQLIYHEEDFDGPNHSVRCGVMTEAALSFADSHAIPVDAVAVGRGPGSYTGLRIGASIAKGICYGRALPLIAIPTTQIMCVPVLLKYDTLPHDALLIPMTDARRMEVYSAVYDRSLHEIRAIRADIVETDTYKEYLDLHPVYFFGDGSAKCREVITHPNAHFIENISPLAKYMSPIAEKAMMAGEFQDAAYFEPFYLKEFVALKSKKLL
ncbi:MAG: tRNA (adenosine(37)-N6)-threonylcarbamoyltransferase complex dimerization subunit type 1 TsaB [Bacteroidaceae bacterium]